MYPKKRGIKFIHDQNIDSGVNVFTYINYLFPDGEISLLKISKLDKKRALKQGSKSRNFDKNCNNCFVLLRTFW